MEHRCSERFNVDIPVLLYQYGNPTAIGRVKNATRFGFLVECDTRPFEAMQPLLIEIHPLDYGEEIMRLHALIIHKKMNSLGVELELLHPRFSQNLRSLLKRYEEMTAPALVKRPASFEEDSQEELMQAAAELLPLTTYSNQKSVPLSRKP